MRSVDDEVENSHALSPTAAPPCWQLTVPCVRHGLKAPLVLVKLLSQAASFEVCSALVGICIRCRNAPAVLSSGGRRHGTLIIVQTFEYRAPHLRSDDLAKVTLGRVRKCDMFTCALVSSVTLPALHLRTLPQGP